jgi:hypothetical protein
VFSDVVRGAEISTHHVTILFVYVLYMCVCWYMTHIFTGDCNF